MKKSMAVLVDAWMLLTLIRPANAIDAPTPSPSPIASDEPSSVSDPPSSTPTWAPSLRPTARQTTDQPSVAPSVVPTSSPTTSPTTSPTASPSAAPTERPVHTAVFKHGNSGKITIYNDRYPGLSDPNAVTMKVSYLREVSKAGKVVGKAGKVKHSIESFGGQAFAFSSLYDTELYGLAAKSFSFTSAVSSIGTLEIEAYTMLEGGDVISNTGEQLTVMPGDFKFSVQLINWKWCNPCQDGTADFIDVGIEIQGRNKKIKNGDLGAGIPLLLAKNIEIDGQIVKMPAGYPKIETVNGKQTFVFRFPKTGGAALYDYDPIIGMARSPQNQ